MPTSPVLRGPSARERVAADGPAPTNADRLILWLARRQWRTLLGGIVFGIPWMLASALVPAAIGRAIDDGIVAQDGRALLQWSAAIFGLGLVAAVTTNLRHSFAVYNWMSAAFRSSLVADASVRRAGPALTRHLPAGEVVTAFSTDMGRMGHVFDVSARFAGAIVSFFVVSVILLQGSALLGLIMLIGGPVLLASLTLVMRPLQRRQTTQREEQGRLTAIGADTVAGLRVLRGIGGEDAFLTRYARQSARVQAAGVRISGVQATLDAAQVLLPGVFVAIVTGVGAHLALAGEISPGQLVAYYGYTAFLTMPLRTATEFVDKLISTRVAARRIVRIIATPCDHPGDGSGAHAGPAGGDLVDHRSGIVIRGGRLTALVCADPDVSARLAARLGRTLPGPSDVTLGGVHLDGLAIEEVRRRLLVSEADPRLFSGDLRAEIGWGRADADILAALHVASAGDVLDSIEGGLDGRLSERGRALSGGQRQRLALARALVRDPDVLIMVEPTSAVDAHTEARIAGRLRAYRDARTTVLTTASPLLLDQADEVVVLAARPGGADAPPAVVARGAHRDLVADSDTYRSIVVRGEDETHALASPSLA